MKQLHQGLLIAIEGIDGSGKTTLAQALTQELARQGYPVLLTRQPGDSPIGSCIRTLLHDASLYKVPKTEFLLFAADRAQHMETVVIPALNRGAIVISDRMADSSVVYQGYVRGLELPMIHEINDWAMGFYKPDLTLYVRVEAATAYQRRIERNVPFTSFEQEPHDFFQQLVDGFDLIMKTNTCAHILDGLLSQSVITQHALEAIRPWIHNKHINL